MAATALNVTTVTEGSPQPPAVELAADNVNGNTVPNGPTTWLHMSNTSTSSATVQVAYASQVDGQTVPPRTYTLPGTLATTLSASTSVGATTITTPVTVPVGTALLIDVGALQEVRTTSAVSGSGPYTLTVPALSQAHSSGVAVASMSKLTAGVFPPALFGQNLAIQASASTVTLAARQLG